MLSSTFPRCLVSLGIRGTWVTKHIRLERPHGTVKWFRKGAQEISIVQICRCGVTSRSTAMLCTLEDRPSGTLIDRIIPIASQHVDF